MILQGDFIVKQSRYAVIVSRFNEFITSKLLGGAIDGLERHGVLSKDIDTIWVPGAMEIPLIANKIAITNNYAAIITLGAVIRGSTSHYEHVCSEVSKGISKVQLKTGIPVIFGILTTENIEQAIERSGTKSGNKGYDAALTAIEMVNLIEKLDSHSKLS